MQVQVQVQEATEAEEGKEGVAWSREDGVNCDRPTRMEFTPKIGSVLLEEYELQMRILRKVVIKSDQRMVMGDGKDSQIRVHPRFR